MVIQEDQLINATSLDARREFMKLSVEDRRRILALQADEIAEHYERNDQVTAREQWQGGDIVEY